jgi:hypothetical protein
VPVSVIEVASHLTVASLQHRLQPAIAASCVQAAAIVSDLETLTAEAGQSPRIVVASAQRSLIPCHCCLWLVQAAAVVSDFEAARQLELARVVSSLTATRAAGDAAAQAWLVSR